MKSEPLITQSAPTVGAISVESAGLLERTFRVERIRAVFSGMLEPAFGTFFLLIAVRRFDASAAAKSLLMAGPSIGMMLGPLSVVAVEALGWNPARAVALFSLLASALLIAGAGADHAWGYVTALTLGGMLLHCVIPLMTQVYQDNYPSRSRGRLFSSALVIRIAGAAAASHLVGMWMTRVPGDGSWVVAGFGAVAMCSALCWLAVPSKPIAPHATSQSPLRGLRFVAEDPVFRRTLISWMLMGTGNLVMLPLRVEHLARPYGGVLRTAAEVALLTAVVPNVARLCASPLWGRAFDRLNFFRLRAFLNLGFACAIVAFFTGDSLGWMLVGAVLYGISTAGGDVAWSLWVTKIAPPERVADYMGVHTFLTGLRGVLAPALAFHAASRVSIEGIGWVCAALVLAANWVLLPELRKARGSGLG